VIVDKKGRELDRYPISLGAILAVKDGDSVKAGQRMAKWDPHSTSIIADREGRARYEDLVEGKTYKEERDATGVQPQGRHRAQGRPAPADRHRGREGQPGQPVPDPGTCVRRDRERREGPSPARCSPRRRAKSGGTQDITGGLPRVTELFEARRPKEPSVMAEIDGMVEIVKK
jgi:DNA-directed RNA polymerase subunit beta'